MDNFRALRNIPQPQKTDENDEFKDYDEIEAAEKKAK